MVSPVQALVRVDQVRVQNRNGAIFSGQRLTPTGQIIDTHARLTVRLPRRAVGTRVVVGQWWEVSGTLKSRTFINHLGFEMTEEQMEVEPGEARLQLPSGSHIVDYLAGNRLYQGIGPVTAKHLWESFGDGLFTILDAGDPSPLSPIVGAGRAATLIEAWAEEGLSDSLQWLHNHGIPVDIGRRILHFFGAETRAKVEENPYRLLSFAAGWTEVDTLARKQLKVAETDERRLAAAVEEVVYRAFSKGHTLVPHADLITGLARILKVNHRSPLIRQAIAEADSNRRLLFDSEDSAYSLGAVILENQAADYIVARIGRHSGAPVDVDRLISAYESAEGHGFALNAEQRQAIHLVAENDFAVITGGAGCGKTTVLKCITAVLDNQGYRIEQMALAGKAAIKMMDATERPAQTLASYISGMAKAQESDNVSIPTEPLAIVIDEASMVDLLSFSGLINLLPPNSKMILIGDPSQLPPVGPGLVLHCLTEVPAIPHVQLKTTKRFGGRLAEIATLVRKGEFPSLDRFEESVRFAETADTDMAAQAAQLFLAQPDDTVVLCATRRVARDVNQFVQQALSPGREVLKLWNLEYDMWETPGFFVGDIVICTRNHWDRGVQNGSMGRLVRLASTEDNTGEDEPILAWIEWDDGKLRPLVEELLDDIELGYAITIHKSQGSQWQRVIACLPASSRMIDRSLIYTALTRSQGVVTVLGNHQRLCAVVRQQNAAEGRKVGFRKRLGHATITVPG